jgi:hypothetical protein
MVVTKSTKPGAAPSAKGPRTKMVEATVVYQAAKTLTLCMFNSSGSCTSETLAIVSYDLKKVGT